MNDRTVIDHDPDTSSPRKGDRELELRRWNRDIGQKQAGGEGLDLTEEHWQVIDFLRQRYLEQGDPESAREVAEDLQATFSEQGGDRYLRKLFPGGPVTQGSRIAGLPVPAYSTDPSFGTSY